VKRSESTAGILLRRTTTVKKKDKSIQSLLKRLRTHLGKDTFHVVDYWDADLCAVAVVRPDNHGVLVYINTFRRPVDHYFVSLELPPTAGADYPYTPAGDFEVKSFSELVELIQKHFSSYSSERW
jgi:hypothetical protein